MGIFFNTDAIVQGVLTRRGREILFNNNERFRITSFSLFDQEINYNLINQNDPDFNNIESLTIFQPSTNENAVDENSRLIRFSLSDLENIARVGQQNFIDSQEYTIETQIQGSRVFSLGNYQNSVCTINFALHNPLENDFFLGTSFIIDLSEFFIKYGIVFNFTPVNPATTFSNDALKNYWFNKDTTVKDQFGNSVATMIGIDNDHKPDNGVSVENITNTINIPLLTFSLSIDQKYVKTIFSYLLNNGLSNLTANIHIINGDNTIKPLTSFFGNGALFSNIATTIPLTITF